MVKALSLDLRRRVVNAMAALPKSYYQYGTFSPGRQSQPQ